MVDFKITEQGWRSGESTRLPPRWPGFNSQVRCHIYGLSLFNADVSSRQRDSKRVLPILPTTSQLLCQKNFARANDPAGNAG